MRTAKEIHAERCNTTELSSYFKVREGAIPELSEVRTWELWTSATWDKPNDRIYTIVTCTYAQAIAMVQSNTCIDYIRTHKPHTAIAIPSHEDALASIK